VRACPPLIHACSPESTTVSNKPRNGVTLLPTHSVRPGPARTFAPGRLREEDSLKKTIFVCAAGLGLMVGCATPSAQQRMARSQAVEVEAASEAEADSEGTDVAVAARSRGDTLICENEPPAGSRLPRTVCRTARDLETERANSQRFLLEGQRTPRFQ